MRLTEMPPRGDLSSTGYALASPGHEYVVLQPAETAQPFTVTLAPGMYTVRWYSVNTRETAAARRVRAGSAGPVTFTAPFPTPGPAVLRLERVGR